jgi:NADP-dependent 3-hydroxy acid dehydrogenase YdfG
MNSRLKDKIAIVTGAGSGIGRARALVLIREGAHVALVGRRKERIENVARYAADSALPLAADVSKGVEIAGVIEQTVKAFGGLNALGTAEQVTEEPVG